MNILIIGSGGREHALCWKIKQSPLCNLLFALPGNAGTSLVAENVNLSPNQFEDIGSFCLDQEIELVIVGPEEPLVKGIKDYFQNQENLSGIKLFGPGKTESLLEGSKDFAKQFMLKYGIPTAKAESFDETSFDQGLKFLAQLSPPYVLKADGLAAGKGVIICETLEQASDNLTDMIKNRRFGEASRKVLIEEFLSGIELSVFVITDGQDYKILPEAKDYKRIGEGDTGPNTGGMGAISPVYFANPEFLAKVEERIIKPTINGLKQDGLEYIGFIFFGLIKVHDDPYVIEYNIRLGDPEAEVVLPRIKTDLVELILACLEQGLGKVELELDPSTASTIMLVSEGYPGEYEKGRVIHNLDQQTDVLLFHAGTKYNEINQVITNGGRVLSLTGMGDTIEQALKKSYHAAEIVNWKGVNYRTDIGQDLILQKSFSELNRKN